MAESGVVTSSSFTEPILTPHDTLQSPQIRKSRCTWRRFFGILFLLIVAFIVISVIVLQFWYLPTKVQSTIDNSNIVIIQSSLTQPAATSFRLTSFMQSDASPPFSAVIHSSEYTFRFCSPQSTLPFSSDPDCSLDGDGVYADSSSLGTANGPDFDISTDGTSTTTMDSVFSIANMTNFKTFSRFLFALPNVTWQVQATLKITITIAGLPFEVHDIHLRKNSTVSGLNSLPGMYTDHLDMNTNSSLSQLFPVVNITANFFNPGTTSIIPLGDLRYVWLYPTRNVAVVNNVSVQCGQVADVMAWNTSIFSGNNTVPSWGPVVPELAPGTTDPFDALGLLLQRYIAGEPGLLIALNTRSWLCCNETIPTPPQLLGEFETGEGDNYPLMCATNATTAFMKRLRETHAAVSNNCTCVNASSIPLYDNFLEGLMLKIQIRPSAPTPLLSLLNYPQNIKSGVPQQLHLTFVNPFQSSMEVDTITWNLIYQNVLLATYSVKGLKAVGKVNAYSSATFVPTQLAVWQVYAPNSPEATVMDSYIDSLQSGAAVSTLVNGTLSLKFMNAPVTIAYALPVNTTASA